MLLERNNQFLITMYANKERNSAINVTYTV